MDTIELKGQSFKHCYLNEDNMQDLAHLFLEIYGTKTEISFLKEKYMVDHIEMDCFGCLMYNQNDVPVGFQGAVPYRLEYKGKEFIGAQSCDSMTHPSYQGMGIFGFLAQRVDELLKAQGVKCIYGFPNQNSAKIFFSKLDWIQSGTMYHYGIATGSFPFGKILMRLGFLKSVYKRWRDGVISRQGKIITGLANSEQNMNSVTVVHDRAFFDYKRNALVLKMKNGTVWLSPGAQILIGDFEVENREMLVGLLEELKRLARKIGVTQLSFQCQQGGINQQMLESITPGTSTWEIGGKSFDMELSPESLLLTYGDLDTF
ncbi:MAG: GNAT family N-acetyltransferase [Roseivirga sp.]|nr:GNAT family N-acetyltransferase [Roseivirga sp.]